MCSFRGLIFVFVLGFSFPLSVYADKDTLFQSTVKNVSESFEDDADLNTELYFKDTVIPEITENVHFSVSNESDKKQIHDHRMSYHRGW